MDPRLGDDGLWRVCAWHQPGFVAPDGRPISHGLCAVCAARVRAEIAAYFKREANP